MTIEPVRLLTQDDDDPFTASLLRSARDGDTAAARSRKAAVLGAAGSAAIGGAALTAAKVSSKGLWAALGAKWLAAIGIVVAGGAGVTAAILWPEPPRQAAGGAPASQAAAPGAPVSHADTAAAPRSPAAETPGVAAAPPPSNDAPAANGPTPHPAASPAARSAAHGPEAAAARPAHAAPAETAPAGSSAAAGAASELAAEVEVLKAAREALGRGQAQRCLQAVDAYFARFPKGHLSAEARLLRVEAMAAGGQRAEAASLARSMLAHSPRSPYAARLRAIAGDGASP